MWKSILAIALGSALGGLLRWALSLRLNPLLDLLPPGTLAANLLGAYIVGFAVAVFVTQPNLPPEWRLFVITGFCGGLTTFSTFSAEIVNLIQRERLLWAFASAATHLLGSLALTAAGMATWFALRPRP
jgi:CrcB protein